MASAPAPIAVLGEGPCGLAVTTLLQFHGFQPLLVGRHEARGLRLHRVEAWGRDFNLEVYHQPPPRLAATQIAFLTAHPKDLEGLLKRLRAQLPAKLTAIVVSAPGAEARCRELMRSFPRIAWRLGICSAHIQTVSAGYDRILEPSARLIWGSLRSRDKGPGEPEQALLRGGTGGFVWHDNVMDLYRSWWLREQAIGTLAAAKGLTSYRDVLGHLGPLRAVTEELWHWGKERWGPWEHLGEKMFGEVLAGATKRAHHPPSAYEALRWGRPLPLELVPQDSSYGELVRWHNLLRRRAGGGRST